MQKRLIFGFIVIFLALSVQDGFFGTNAEDFAGTAKSSALVIATKTRPTAKTETHVVRVVDGDTIVVLINGVQEKVRLIGVDTPEIFDPRGLAQCFGEEANVFTRSLLDNKVVRLEADASQGDRDKYERLLRYVYLDNTLVNERIISEGYGHE